VKTVLIKYVQMLAGVILLTQIATAACNNTTQMSSGQQDQSTSHEFNTTYKEITEYITLLEDLAMELKEFKWRNLDDIGKQTYPGTCGTNLVIKSKAQTTGGFTWLPLTGMLPRAENAKPVLAYCETCFTMLDDMQTGSAYSAQETDSGETAAETDLQEQCDRLESVLNGAENLIKNYLKTAHNQFIDIEDEILKSGGEIEKDYFNTFHTQAQTYLDLLENMLDTIDRAKQGINTLRQSETAG
jgi:hypothetical protein